MAGHKRASMREGPLAQLFRKTDEEGLGEGLEPGAPPARQAAPAPAPAAGPVAPSTAGAFGGERPDVPPRPAEPAPAPAPSPAAERRSPTPQERLRAAFSSEIPDDVMAPPSVQPPADPYARSNEPAIYGAPMPGGQPVLRVVGVGGAGVNAVNRMVEAEV